MAPFHCSSPHVCKGPFRRSSKPCGGSGGEGLSFNVGLLPPTYFGERGVRSALSVQLLSSARRVEVWYAHALLAQSVGELALTLEHVNDLIQVCHPGELLHVVKSVLEPLRRVTTLLLGPRFLLKGVDEPCFRRRMWCAGER